MADRTPAQTPPEVTTEQGTMPDTPKTTATMTPARVRFDGPRPVSQDFDDIYADADGAAEAARVFLEPAAIAERTRHPGTTFTVGEFGFGTGLNFVVTAEATRCRLHFISFERHPLAYADLHRALRPWQADHTLVRPLLDAYPPLIPGWHRRLFDAGRVQLSVFFGDIEEGLADLARQQRRGVDAWFLDGFAPRKNPAMWRGELLCAMAGLSAPRASVTTFTAAGQVRRDLAAAGFEVRRVDQRPRKRHSTAAVFTGKGRTFTPPAQVAVVGAGLAGAATARALADKGIAANLVHRGEGIACGASGIPAAVLRARLSPVPTAEARLRTHAFAFAVHRCRGRDGAAANGVLQLGTAWNDAQRLREMAQAVPGEVAVLVSAASATDLAGIPVTTPGLFFPSGLTIAGAVLATDLATHPSIHLSALAAERSEAAVRATGADLDGFETLEVTRLAGQLDRFPCAVPPRLPIVGDGTIVPARDGVWAGATYEYRPWDPERATQANAARFERVIGETPGAALARFRGVRAITSDHLPVVGCEGSVWFNLGHGSHGTSTAIFAAEIIASALNGEVAPASVELLALLHPGRFRERQKRRPNPFGGGHS